MDRFLAISETKREKAANNQFSGLKGFLYRLKLVALFFLQSVIANVKFTIIHPNQFNIFPFHLAIDLTTPIDERRKYFLLHIKHFQNVEFKKISLTDKKDGSFFAKFLKNIFKDKKFNFIFLEDNTDTEIAIYTNQDFDEESKKFVEECSNDLYVNILNSSDKCAYKISCEMLNDFVNKTHKYLDIDVELYKKCLSKLIFLVGQKNLEQVEEKIKENISERFNLKSGAILKEIYNNSTQRFSDWGLECDNPVQLSEEKDFFLQSFEMYGQNTQLTINLKADIQKYDLEFTCLDEFKSKLSKCRFVNLKTIPGGCKVTLCKLYNAFDSFANVMYVDGEILNTEGDKIKCNLKFSKVINKVIIQTNKKIEELHNARDLVEIVKENDTKSIIVIHEFLDDYKLLKDIPSAVLVEDTLKLDDLSQECQDTVQCTEILFQNQVVTISELFQNEAKNLLRDNLLAAVLLRTVEVASFENEIKHLRNYIPRILKKKYNANIDDEMEVITEKGIVDVCNKTNLVVISGIAGMGKTTVLKSIAEVVHLGFPELYIVKINLCNKTKLFAEIKEKFEKTDEKEETYKDFPLKKLIDSLTFSSKLESIMLDAMMKLGKIAIFLDGYDEICPNYEVIVTNIIKELLESKQIRQIYLTTRPHLEMTIEQNLTTEIYHLVGIDQNDQAKYMLRTWLEANRTSKLQNMEIKEVAEKLILKMSHLSATNDAVVNGCALQLTMLAEHYPECNSEVQALLNDSENDINLAELFDLFFNKKVEWYLTEKLKAIKTDPGFNYIINIHKENVYKHHVSAAVKKVAPSFMEEKEKTSLRDFNNPHETIRYGIVASISMEPDVIDFVHPLYCNYLAAKFFYEELTNVNHSESFKNKLASEILIKTEYKTLRQFINSEISNNNKINSLMPIGYIFDTSTGSHIQDNCNGQKAMHMAATENNLDLLRYLVSGLKTESENTQLILNSSCHEQDNEEYTVLHTLAELSSKDNANKYAEIIKYLVSLGADITKNSKQGKSVISLAIGNEYVLKYLLKLETNKNWLNDETGNAALLKAIKIGNLQCIRLLIQNDANVINNKKVNVTEVIFKAAENGYIDIVQKLWSLTSYAEIKDNKGKSILHIAAEKEHWDIVDYLLQNGACIDEQDKNGNTLLHTSVYKNNLNGFKHLLEKGANVNCINKQGSCALQWAAFVGNLQIVECLIKNGSNINHINKFGQSALHKAAEKGHKDIVEYLLQQNVDLNQKDNDGNTVLQIAKLNKYPDIVKLLDYTCKS